MLAYYPIPILLPTDVLLNLNRVLITVDITLLFWNLTRATRTSSGRLRRSDRGRGLSLRCRGGRWVRGCTRVSIVPSFPFLFRGISPLVRGSGRWEIIIPAGWTLAITFAVRTDRGWRRRRLQPGTGSHLRRRALGKHGLIKDGLRSREDDIVRGAHEEPTFAPWGCAQVGHQLGLWRKFVRAHFSRDEDVCSTAEDPKVVY